MSSASRIVIAGLEAIPDLSGALYLPDFATLVVADLHLEKASSLARRGVHLPPYDTRETLAQLAGAIAAARPRRLVFLGDSFHDREASGRLQEGDLRALKALIADLDVVWVAGNHDPTPPADFGGFIATDVALGPLTLRHEPAVSSEMEIAGHLHPSAALSQRGRRLTAKCFVGNGKRLIMPAFGSFTGGLSVHAPPFAPLFPDQQFHVWMLGARAIHRFPSSRLFGGHLPP